METTAIRAYLPVELTEAERLEAGVKAAELQQKLDLMKSEAKQSSKEWKTQIEDVEEDFRAHLTGVQTGIMTKETDAIEVRDTIQKLQWIEKNGKKHHIEELKPRDENMFERADN